MIQANELDNLIICKKCHTLHEKIPLLNGKKTLCTECHRPIYQRDDKLIDKTLALVITAFISLVIAFKFTIVTININGLEQSLTLMSLFAVIAEYHEYLVGIILFFLIVLFPFVIIVSMMIALILMKNQKGAYTVKRLLIMLAHIQPWSMVDIFFISLLVAMVKLFSYAHIELGVAFIAFVFTLILDMLISKGISFYELWEAYETIYGKKN